MNESLISGVPFLDNVKFDPQLDSVETFIRFSLRPRDVKSGHKQRRLTSSIVVRFWGYTAKSKFFESYIASKKSKDLQDILPPSP